MDNAALASHEFLQKEFIAKGCRDVPYPKCDAEFKEIYAQNTKDAPEHEKWMWNYPPDFKAMEKAEYWHALGLPRGNFI